MGSNWWETWEPVAKSNPASKSNRGQPVKRARKKVARKTRRAPTGLEIYNQFIADAIGKGASRKQAQSQWKIHKQGGTPTSHKTAWKKTRKKKRDVEVVERAPSRAKPAAKSTRRKKRGPSTSQQKRNQNNARKAMQLHHSEGISLAEAWEWIREGY